MGRDHHDAVAVAQKDVPRKHRHVAVGYGHGQAQRLVQGQVRRGRGIGAIGWHRQFADPLHIAKIHIRDHARAAPRRKAGDKDRPGACGPRVLAPVHHQDPARRAAFNRHPLRIIALKLVPGQNLSRVEIADFYRVSQTPVRDAMMR
jgi:hypothetical protein